MSFTEKPFFILLAIVFILWLLAHGRYRAKLFILLAASLIFYGHNRWWLLVLLLTYCVVDWAVAAWIARSRRPGWVLTLGVAFNLGVLAYWKYTPLLLATIARAALALDLPAPVVPGDDWRIPFGISFYTFTGIAYLVDVYGGSLAPETSLARFTLYKTFFPQLVAGPILRPTDFLGSLQPATMPDRPQAPLEATLLLARGYFKKVVLADRLALAIDPFFSHVGDLSTAGVWALPYVWLYALQIYFDFSGYTDIARGLGLWFGFRWPENFNLPYLATSVQDFWHRWHMSLSRFLRDYLFIPLGGSHGGNWATCRNLMLTMLLGGLWHGASWTFLLWGGLHGSLLVGHRFWSLSAPSRWLRALTGPARLVWQGLALALTFHAVCLCWCFFRLTVLADSLICVRKWWVFDLDRAFVGGSADVVLWLLLVLYGFFVLFFASLRRLPWLQAWQDQPSLGSLGRGLLWGTAAGLLLLAFVLSPGVGTPPFIYFQF